MTEEHYELLPPSGAEQGLTCASSPRPQGSEEVLLLRAFLLRIAALALCVGAVVVICAFFLLVV